LRAIIRDLSAPGRSCGEKWGDESRNIRGNGRDFRGRDRGGDDEKSSQVLKEAGVIGGEEGNVTANHE